MPQRIHMALGTLGDQLTYPIVIRQVRPCTMRLYNISSEQLILSHHNMD